MVAILFLKLVSRVVDCKNYVSAIFANIGGSLYSLKAVAQLLTIGAMKFQAKIKYVY